MTLIKDLIIPNLKIPKSGFRRLFKNLWLLKFLNKTLFVSMYLLVQKVKWIMDTE